jgi:hypothetical protein
VLPVFIIVGVAHGEFYRLGLEEAGKGRLCLELTKIIAKTEKRLYKSFQSHCNKHNGKLNLRHLTNVIADAGFKFSEQEKDQWELELDKGDGTIGFEQFKQWWMSGHYAKEGMASNFTRNIIQLISFTRQIHSRVRLNLTTCVEENRKIMYEKSAG